MLNDLPRRLTNTLHRRAQILACPHIPLPDRLLVALSKRAIAVPLVIPLVRVDQAGLTVSIAGLSFHVPVQGDARMREDRLRAFTQVIAETFVDPVLFRGQVTPKSGDVVFDLGAHIGTTAAVLARRVGPAGRVFAFEPGEVQTLRNNVKANALANVEVVPAAVGATSGSVNLSMGVAGIDNSIIHQQEWHGSSHSVPLTSLDDFVAERQLARVDFIKMDIEGAEEPALLGAVRTIARFRPKWSISSYHTDAAGELQHPKLMAILRQSGYRLHEIPGFHIFAY